MITLFAEAPALPLHAAGKYVAGAYIVFILMLVIYVGIMVRRLQTNQTEIAELKLLLEERERQETAARLPESEQVA
jgi:TRAP-type C4-dicarboxylate transport system permease small subunit